MQIPRERPRRGGALPPNVAFCGGAAGAGGGTGLPTTLGVPSMGEFLPLLLLLGAFVAAGAWMFRRFGGSAAPGQEPSGTVEAPRQGGARGREATVEPRPGRRHVTASPAATRSAPGASGA